MGMVITYYNIKMCIYYYNNGCRQVITNSCVQTIQMHDVVYIRYLRGLSWCHIMLFNDFIILMPYDI